MPERCVEVRRTQSCECGIRVLLVLDEEAPPDVCLDSPTNVTPMPRTPLSKLRRAAGHARDRRVPPRSIPS